MYIIFLFSRNLASVLVNDRFFSIFVICSYDESLWDRILSQSETRWLGYWKHGSLFAIWIFRIWFSYFFGCLCLWFYMHTIAWKCSIHFYFFCWNKYYGWLKRGSKIGSNIWDCEMSHNLKFAYEQMAQVIRPLIHWMQSATCIILHHGALLKHFLLLFYFTSNFQNIVVNLCLVKLAFHCLTLKVAMAISLVKSMHWGMSNTEVNRNTSKLSFGANLFSYKNFMSQIWVILIKV